MLILIAGPYRSGTGDDPDKMAANLRRLEEVSWPLFEAGHVPMIGEWVALPVWRSAGGMRLGDDLYDRIFYPTAERLLRICDAVLRLPGASQGADNDVRLAREQGLPVYYDLSDVPGVKARKRTRYALIQMRTAASLMAARKLSGLRS